MSLQRLHYMVVLIKKVILTNSQCACWSHPNGQEETEQKEEQIQGTIKKLLQEDAQEP